MQARNPGVCVICGKRYEVGSAISWIRHGSHRGRKYHEDCRSAMSNDEFAALLETLPPLYEGEDYSHGPRVVEAIEPTGSELLGLDDEIVLDEPEKPVEALPENETAKMLAKILKRLDALEAKDNVTPAKATEGSRPEFAHAQFDTVLYFAQAGQHVYLHGAPGSGKSTLASQIAEYMGLKYGYVSLNPQTSEFRLLGFKDASGRYNETDFRRVYEHGGIFCIDEMDNANPSLLTTLNGMLENDLAAFPDGMVKRHRDFVLIATGNTTGRGASRAFPDRRKFDAAFAERFVFVAVEYDEAMESSIASAINKQSADAVRWVQAVRRWAASNAPELVVSPRASYKLAQFMGNGCPLKGVALAHAILFKGVSEATVTNLLAANPIRGAF